MHQIKIDTFSKVKEAFALVDTEYVDVTLSKSSALLVANNSEIFVQAIFSAVSTVSATDTSFRIKRDVLLSLCGLGYIEAEIVNGYVSLRFTDSNNREIYSIKFLQQLTLEYMYTEKTNVIADMLKGEYKKFSAAGLGSFAKISKLTNGLVNLNNDYASVITNQFAFYREHKMIGDVSVTGKALAALTKMSNELFDAKNYVGAVSENVCVLCTKCRGNSNEEVALAIKSGAKYVAEVSLSNLFEVIKKCKITDNVIKLDFNQHRVELKVGNVDVIVPLICSSEQSTGTGAAPTLTISLALLKILNSVGDKKAFKIKAKKSFNVLHFDDFLLVV